MEAVEFAFERRVFKVHTHGGDDHLFKKIKREKSFYEIDLLKAVRDAHPPGRAIFDVGANIGNHTLFFAGVMGQRVTSFEPFSKSFDILTRNIEANGLSSTADARRLGLGDADGRADADNVKPHNYGVVRLRSSPDGEIKIARLDDFAPGGVSIGSIKIDVEGGEMAVLRGARQTIERERPHIFIEASRPKKHGDVSRFLADFSYREVACYCATPTYHFAPA